ncbi:Gfo/Idh/MocA family oxidoreductase [Phycisphaeraceae bacterium D3-23]
MTDHPHDLTRRKFVAGSAAAVAAPMMLTGKPWALAQQGNTAANDKISIGMIGTGIRGRNMLRNYFLRSDRFHVRAICDVDTTRREHYQQFIHEHYGNTDCDAYLDFHELLARDDIDAVVIATPDHWHANMIIHACNAGKDIYCEKPLTLSLHEGKTVIDAVRKHNIVFQTGSQQRTEFGHKFVRACEYVRSGKLGRVISVNVGVADAPTWCDLPEEAMEPGLDWDRWQGPVAARGYHSELSPRGVHNHYPRWRAYRDYCGGYLADMGAHHFDIAQWGLGKDGSGPVKIVPPADRDAKRGAELVYADGVRLIHGGPSGTTFVGTSGVLAVDRGRIHSVPETILDTPLEEGDVTLPRHAGHAINWADCIQSREKPICDVEVGAGSAAICQLMNIAYFLGKEAAWDPENWVFDDDEANALLDYDRRAGYELPDF